MTSQAPPPLTIVPPAEALRPFVRAYVRYYIEAEGLVEPQTGFFPLGDTFLYTC